jgi:signal transduction protein with GAF and PtsI domain
VALFMPDDILPLRAFLWDLRSQCESQLRALKAAQRLLDEYRRGANVPADREAARRSLQDTVKSVVAANAAIREVTAQVSRQIERLRGDE